MSEVQNSARSQGIQQRLKSSKARARELLELALGECDSLFEHGDLRPYVEVLSRFHGYNFYNLLLLLKQYPAATHLAPFQIWEQRLGDPSQLVLKPEHFGNGIELVAPYTDIQKEGTRSLFWSVIRRFDISQTNITGISAPSKNYLPEPAHSKALVAALRILLSEHHNVSLIYERSNPDLEKTGAPGYREDFCLFCRYDVPPGELLHWLCGILMELSHPERILGDHYTHLFCQLGTSTLLRIWDISDPSLLYIRPNRDLIRSVPPELRPIFLDFLQRQVRTIEEHVFSYYQERKLARGEDAISYQIQKGLNGA